VSEAERKGILEAAARDPGLLREVPAVVAAGFGVLPLRRLGDVLTVACLPGASRRALRALRRVLGVEVVATPFERESLLAAIRDAYLSGEETVNYPTFLDPDFLDDPAAVAALGAEKVEAVPPARLELPPDRVALVTLSYRSTLESLDAPARGGALPDLERTKLQLGPLDVGWVRRGEAVHVHPGPAGLPDDARVLLTEYRATDVLLARGVRSSEHAVRACALDALPHVIHPTEVQLVGVDRQGGLALHVYDRLERVAPGARRRLEVAYCFLSYGTRLRRTIELVVEEVITVARRALDVHNHPAPWGAEELGRWLGVTAPPQE
jgi:hypothetical protein